jgi:hypothetical protein
MTANDKAAVPNVSAATQEMDRFAIPVVDAISKILGA